MQIKEIKEKAEKSNYNWEIFDIKQELGAGTFGQVFACIDQSSGQKFALKFINYEDETEKDPEFKSAVREIVLMQSLMKANCSAILKIHDVYPCVRDDSKFLVLVMELCDCNLMELIKVRIEENYSRWSDEELLYILFQLVEGFYIMKKHSIAHRDIKPQNILYSTQDKWYKIADLGGSKFFKPPQNKQYLDGCNTVRGSPAYWAPEIYYFCELQKDKEGRFFVGKQHLPYNPYQSDVYSVGITILLMRKLVPRMDRESIKKEIDQMKKQKELKYLDQILLKMLENEESKRISFDQLYEILRREKDNFKQPNEDIYVNCLKTGKDKKDMNSQELLDREINLGEAYEKLYLLQHAKTHYEQAFKLAHKLGKDNLKGDILNNMGTVNCDLGQLDEAERNYLDCITYYKKINGEKHTSVGDAYNNLGIVKRKKGEYEKAIKYYEQAYQIKEQVFGENNLGVALILGNMAMAYRKIGDLDQSIKYYKNALQLKKLICGDSSIILCGTYDNLARVYYLKQQYDQAISCYQVTAEIYRKFSQSNKSRLADALFELGQCYQNVGKNSDAVKVFTEASNIRKQETNIKDHIVCLEHLAQSLLEDKQFEKGLQIYQLLKEMYQKQDLDCTKIERLDSTIDIIKNIGAAYMSLGQIDQAFDNYKEALTLVQTKGNDNSRTAKILYNIALVYRRQNKLDLAKDYYLQAVKQISSSMEQNDLQLLGDIYNNMGVLYGRAQDWKMAQEYFQNALNQYIKLYGLNHQICQEVQKNLAQIDKYMKRSK